MNTRCGLVWAFVTAASLAASCSSDSSNASGTSTGGRAGREKGAREATEAIAAGQLKLKEYPPLPSPAELREYIRLLRERCGVEYEVPSPPPGVSEADFIQEVRGWNEVMETAIKQKHGADILEELRKEAHKRWSEHVKPSGK